MVLIFGLLAAIALPTFGVRDGAAARDDGQDLAALLEYARQRAVGTGAPHRVVVDLDRGAYWLEARAKLAPDPLPERWSDLEELPLAAPRTRLAEFARVSGQLGDVTRLRDEVFFEEVDVADDLHRAGTVALAFDPSGGSDTASLALRDPSGGGVDLRLTPLAEAVRIERAN